MKVIEHGANLHQLAAKYDFDIDEIMDFSSNINPFGASKDALDAVIANPHMVSVYPDPYYHALKASISRYSSSKEENIVLGSGATSLISGYIRSLAPKKALVLSPAYSEYKKELDKISAEVFEFFLDEKNNFIADEDDIIGFAKENGCSLIIICNPNNPTGSILTRNQIEKIAKESSANILIDETYIEFTDKNIYSSSCLVDDNENIFVIRGTSKFFSSPGIRLGYGLLSDKKIIEDMSKSDNLWGVNIFADIMGQKMFDDKDYQKRTFELINQERDYLIKSLSAFSDFIVYPSQGNFILTKIHSEIITAAQLYHKLLQKKIIIRNCSSFSGLTDYHFRVCTLSHKENELLINSLEEIINDVRNNL